MKELEEERKRDSKRESERLLRSTSFINLSTNLTVKPNIMLNPFPPKTQLL